MCVSDKSVAAPNTCTAIGSVRARLCRRAAQVAESQARPSLPCLLAKDRPSLRFTPDGELHVTERMPPRRLVARRLTSAVPVRIRALLPARPPCMPCATGLHAILAAVLAIPSSRLKNCDKAARVAQECFSSRQPVDRTRPTTATVTCFVPPHRCKQSEHAAAARAAMPARQRLAAAGSSTRTAQAFAAPSLRTSLKMTSASFLVSF